jgi:hypothetical protein
MAQQSSGEFASADPTTGAQDARVQERRIGAKISLNACGNPQHCQRPAPSHVSKNAPSFQGVSYADVARRRRCGVSLTHRDDLSRLLFGNATKRDNDQLYSLPVPLLILLRRAPRLAAPLTASSTGETASSVVENSEQDNDRDWHA